MQKDLFGPKHEQLVLLLIGYLVKLVSLIHGLNWIDGWMEGHWVKSNQTCIYTHMILYVHVSHHLWSTFVPLKGCQFHHKLWQWILNRKLVPWISVLPSLSNRQSCEAFMGSIATKDWPTIGVPSAKAQGHVVKSEILGCVFSRTFIATTMQSSYECISYFRIETMMS